MAAILKNPISMYTDEYFGRPMITATIGPKRVAQVMSPDLAQFLLQGEGKFVGRSEFALRFLTPALGNGLLTAEGASWRRQRRAASPAFRARALDALEPTFRKAGIEAGERLALRRGEETDIGDEMVAATFDVILETLLPGLRPSYPRAEIAEDMVAFMTTVGKVNLLDFFPRLQKVVPRRLFTPGYSRGMAAVGRLRSLAQTIVKERLADGSGSDRGDLMGLLIAAEDEETGDRLSPEELVDNALTFVAAGHETTAVALTWTLSILAELPDLQTALAEEASAADGAPPLSGAYDLHERVLKESMRLFPPVPIIPRTITEEVEIGGNRFGPGDHVSVAVYPMHRHRQLWDNPLAFEPDRFTREAEANRHRYQFLPFGAGPRVCIGQRFAMMEAIAILSELVQRVRFETTEPLLREPYLAITMRPATGLRLRTRAR
jgi:cytochrome P450